MSNVSKKMLMAAAGAAGGAGLDVDECFSCHLYEGTASAQTITNNIDLSGEGGLVWIKQRDTRTRNHALIDTVRGNTKRVASDYNGEEFTSSSFITQFNSNGFAIGTASNINQSGAGFVSWTFLKAKKFFDCQTYTGDGTSNFSKKVSHNLGQRPGMVFVKNTSASSNWLVWYPLMDGSAYNLNLNNTNQSQSSNETNGRAYVESSGDYRLQVSGTGTGVDANKSGDTYVAYFFAHNNNDGGFGPDGDQDIIKCGSFTGSSSSDVTVNVGFEPQWLLTRRTGGGNWTILDNMRGIITGGIDPTLFADTSSAENTGGDRVELTSTGFIQKSGQTGNETVIYMAIRRGPLAVPDDATKVFTAVTNGTPDNTEFRPENVDMAMFAKRGGDSENFQVADRVRGFQSTSLNSDDGYTTPTLETNNTNAEDTSSTSIHQTEGQSAGGPYIRGVSSGSNFLMYRWKRAPSYFDCVCYSGTGSAMTINHNLGVAPEMMWVKKRSSADDWRIYHASNGIDYAMSFSTSAKSYDPSLWNGTSPTSSVFSLGNDSSVINGGSTFIAYLFATVAGVSKVGSYTGNGASSQVIDCGFSSGARFVMIKRTDASADWYVWDSTRGIVAGNDARLALNNTSAEQSGDDQIDPNSSGFEVPLSGGLNNNGLGPYIFYAIA